MTIGDYIDGHNKNPKSFIGTAKASDILAKVSRAKIALNKTTICVTDYTSCLKGTCLVIPSAYAPELDPRVAAALLVHGPDQLIELQSD
jgi:hypothetical protein